MLLAVRCPVCRRPGGVPCAECRELFVPLGSVPPPPGVATLHAALSYRDAARPLVAGLKYRDQRGAVGFLADVMVSVLSDQPPPEVVTWAPTTPARRRQRGFDHAELLARAVARRLRVPCRNLLIRHDGPAQTGRAGAERRHAPTGFEPRRRPPPPAVLLVDDVVTTGATLSAAARALHRAGAHRVTGVVAAATPSPGARGQ